MFLGAMNAQMFQSVDKPILLQKGQGKQWCGVCGMHLGKFYKTNHAIEYNKSYKQYCSLHCLVQDKEINHIHHKVDIDKYMVVDTNNHNFIDANNAFYIVGSSIKGTMSMNSKYAFSSKEDAIVFKNKNGGELLSFNKAYKVAISDLNKDNHMIEKKRSLKAYPMGKMIADKMCDNSIYNIESDDIAKLKIKIKTSNICKPLKPMQLQALSLYLNHEKSTINGHIEVPKDAKCPVCGMFVYKYPKWAAVLENHHGSLYFDGVKDLMKYILNNNSFKNIYVSDYYTMQKIDARKAFYVIGSNVYGPMGKELIPFKTKEEAKTFSHDHLGKKIINFKEINKSLIDSL